MPTVLQINTSANLNSTGRIAAQIGDLAISRGWESWIAYGHSARECRSRLYHIDTEPERIWHGAMSLLFDRQCRSSANATRRFVRFIRQIGPDVIHLHNIHGCYLNMELLFGYLSEAGIPVVWTFHDCWPYTGHCSHYSNIGCRKWQTGCMRCPKRNMYPRSILLDRSEENYALKKRLFNSVKDLTVVPVSFWLGEEVKKSFFSSKTVRVIGNGVDLDVFRPVDDTEGVRKRYGIGNGHILLAVASVWAPQKGWGDYVKLSGMLPDDCRIVMVGVPGKMRKELPDSIIAIPRTESSRELAELYSAADIVLNLSSQESFGLTTVEGFACGTPGIVYDCTASPELISPDTGRVVEYGDLGAVVRSVEELLRLGPSMSGKCRERAEFLYDKNRKYEEYIGLYNSLLKK